MESSVLSNDGRRASNFLPATCGCPVNIMTSQTGHVPVEGIDLMDRAQFLFEVRLGAGQPLNQADKLP